MDNNMVTEESYKKIIKQNISNNKVNTIITNENKLSDSSSNKDPILNNINNVRKSSKEFNKILYEKALYLQNMHTFLEIYVDQLVNILQSIINTLSNKITECLDNNKVFLNFYKDIMHSYNKLNSELGNSNSHMQKFDKDRKSSDNLFGNINHFIEKIQKIISNKFSTFSNVINQQIITKGPFIKIKELYTKLSVLNKNHNEFIQDIVIIKEELIKINKENCKVTDSIIKAIEKAETDNKFDELIKKHDLFNMEIQYLKKYNKCILLITNFLIANKVIINDLKVLLTDFVGLIKDSITQYLGDTDKIFKSLDLIEILKSINSSLSKEIVLAIFKPLVIFSDSEDLTNLSECLIKFACNNNKYIFVKNKLPVNNLEENLNISQFNNIEDLITFIQLFIPVTIDGKKSNFIQTLFEIKRDPGILSKTRPSFLVLTFQNNIIVYDEKIYSSPVDIYKYEFVTFKVKDEKKFRFEIIEDNKKSLFTSSLTFETTSKEKLEEFETLFKK